MHGVLTALVAVSLLTLAGCIDPVDPAHWATGLPALEQGHDHVVIRSDHVAGPVTLALRVWADQPTQCSGQFSAWSRGPEGIWGWTEDSLGAIDGLVYAGPGVHTTHLDVQLLSGDTELPVYASVSNESFTGERWLWFHVPDAVPDHETHGLGWHEMLPRFDLQVSCPGAKLDLLFGAEATSLHWLGTGEAGANAAFGHGGNVDSGATFTIHEPHARFTLLRDARTDGASVLETPQGLVVHDPDAERIQHELGPGDHVLRSAARGQPPIGIVMQAGPGDLHAWHNAVVSGA